MEIIIYLKGYCYVPWRADDDFIGRQHDDCDDDDDDDVRRDDDDDNADNNGRINDSVRNFKRLIWMFVCCSFL